MRLNKIDLTKIVAIGHEDDHLQLLIDRGTDIEYLEIPAPFAAYAGLQQLDEIIRSDYPIFEAVLGSTPLPSNEPEIAMLPARSTMANAVGHDSDRQLLQVEFQTGAIYQYEDVATETWAALQAADSKGKFFHQEIKGLYRSRRIC
jgi:hypothetical protein